MPKADFATVSHHACGQWPEILSGLGIDGAFLKKKHGPCPACGGKDRFRFDDKDGRGMFFCNQCGSGDGFVLLEKVYGWDRAESLKCVAAWLGLDQGEAITADERNKARQRSEAQRKEQEQVRQKELRENAIAAAERWEAAQLPPFKHDYLTTKKVSAEGIRLLEGELLVPLFDQQGHLCNLQRIFKNLAADGQGPAFEKRFLGPGVTGCYHLIGNPGKRLFIAEGYATAVSVHRAMGEAVAVAFNTGNLKPAAMALKARYPKSLLVLAADNDKHHADNPGLSKAREAASAVNGVVVWPDFTKQRDYGGSQPTDFNDLAFGEGTQAIKNRIESQLKGSSTRKKKAVNQEQNESGTATRKSPYVVSDKGVYFSPPDGSDPSWVCGRLDVLARTRDESSSNWGLLVSFKDNDGNLKMPNIPAEILAGDSGGEVVKKLLG